VWSQSPTVITSLRSAGHTPSQTLHTRRQRFVHTRTVRLDDFGTGCMIKGFEPWVQDRKFRLEGSGIRVQEFGFRVSGFGFRVSGSGFRVKGSGFRVQGSGFRVQGSGFRVQGSEFRGESLEFRV